MALRPLDNGDVTSSSDSGLVGRVIGGVIGAVVLYFIAAWLIGFVFTLVRFAIFAALIAGAVYLYFQVTKKDR